LNKTNNSLLAVGKVIAGFPQLLSNQISLNEYLKVVSENFKESINKKGNFLKMELNFTQYLIQKQNLISFKLIFELNDTIYQFDYTTQKETYQHELKSIESSMGTIKPITK
jgi:predicted small secreted protein